MTAPGQVASAAQDQAGAVAGTAKEQAGQVAATAAGAAGDVTGTAKEQAGQVVGETVGQVKDLAGQVREQVGQQVGQQSDRLTSSLRDVSRQLSEGDTSGIVGSVLSEVGTRVQRLADHLEQTGPQGLVEEVRQYARRSPGTFLLGAALAGLVTGRLVKGMGAGSSTPALPSGGTTPHSGGTAAGDPLAGLVDTTVPTPVTYAATGNDPFGGDTYGTGARNGTAGTYGSDASTYGTGTATPYPGAPETSPYESGYGTSAPYGTRGAL